MLYAIPLFPLFCSLCHGILGQHKFDWQAQITIFVRIFKIITQLWFAAFGICIELCSMG